MTSWANIYTVSREVPFLNTRIRLSIFLGYWYGMTPMIAILCKAAVSDDKTFLIVKRVNIFYRL